MHKYFLNSSKIKRTGSKSTSQLICFRPKTRLNFIDNIPQNFDNFVWTQKVLYLRYSGGTGNIFKILNNCRNPTINMRLVWSILACNDKTLHNVCRMIKNYEILLKNKNCFDMFAYWIHRHTLPIFYKGDYTILFRLSEIFRIR